MIVVESERSEHKNDKEEEEDVRNETSNCDYISEVFREQISELEYSKLLQDSEEKENKNLDQNMIIIG